MNTKSAPTYWRSLEQLAETPEIQQLIENEFPGYDPKAIVDVPRRRFLKLMGASMALAGVTLTGCRRWPKETITPYVSSPPNRTPGVPELYATVMDLNGVAYPLLVTTVDGRPVKIEGNPTHSFSRKNGKVGERTIGATDIFAQASILELYDPERSRAPLSTKEGKLETVAWDDANTALIAMFDGIRQKNGAGFAILTQSSDSSVLDLKNRLLKAMPQAQWVEYQPISRDNETQGLKLAFGQAVRPIFNLAKAETVVLFDADLLGNHPGKVRYANDWAQMRKSADTDKKMSRVFIFESTFSTTGSVADERMGVRPSRLPMLVTALAAKLGVAGITAPTLSEDESHLIEDAFADLQHSKSASLVAAGSNLPAEVHAIVAAINAKLGANGNTVSYIAEPGGERPTHVDAITQLAEKLKSGAVNTLLVLGGNPAYDAPADLDFTKLIEACPSSVHVGLYFNETAKACKLHVPQAHYLESWGDGISWDGKLSVQQPMILPLYGGKSIIEVLSLAMGEKLTGEEIIRRSWEKAAANENEWRRILHDGVAGNLSFPAPTVNLTGSLPAVAVASDTKNFELRFLPSQTFDGRYANNGWLQELPDVMTKIVWDNAALISKKDADQLGVKNGDLLVIKVGEKTLEIAAYIQPGQPIGVIGLPLGYGRSVSGHVGTDVGFDTYTLRGSKAMQSAVADEVSRTGKSYALVLTQDHHLIDSVGFKGRENRIGEKGHSGSIVKEAAFAAFKEDPRAPFAGEYAHVPLQLFESPDDFKDGHQWGMAVDMSACIGCNACTIACQAENNVPVVGKEQVAMNREMHWLRIDRYYKGAPDDPNPDVVHQPMMCVHCENAPCEQVCPVAATLHDTEGLNVMVYNRCIGTRYCLNNCPYKVRRFNYLDYQSRYDREIRGSKHFPLPYLNIPDMQPDEQIDKIRRMVFNPEVTVRMRGVMEKCTYCVQRIHNTKIAKKAAGDELKDGDVVTACQQVCPTEAITFGDLRLKDSAVTKLHGNVRAYDVLSELNTRPRTKHLAKLRNPVSHEGHIHDHDGHGAAEVKDTHNH